MGATLQELGRLDEALASYAQAIALKPDYAEAYSNLGNSLQELGRLDEALANYKTAHRINPNLDIETSFAAALLRKEDSENALPLLEQFLKKYPQDARANAYKTIALRGLDKFDRQRTEIKVYDKSPDRLKATENSKFIYQWKFKIDKKSQSFKKLTHFFQLKGVGLPYGMPLMTLTTRKGANEDLNRFEIRHAAQRKSNTIKVQKLQPFLGKWLQVNVEVNFGNKGKLVIQITSMKDSNRLLHYESNSIKMWKDYADFIRPKWGIYRSLKYKDALRDEAIYFADIVIWVN